MKYTIVCQSLEIKKIHKNIVYFLSCNLYAWKKYLIVGFSSRLFMFIITLYVVLNYNHVQSMSYDHIRADVKCSSQMMDDYNRMQVTPLVFVGKVIRKEKIQDPKSNWKLISYVKVTKTVKDIYSPPKLKIDRYLWIGLFSEQINNTPCLNSIKNNSDYIFFATQLSTSRNSFQSLFAPEAYSLTNLKLFRRILLRPSIPLGILPIPSYNITEEGKIKVQCKTTGYPTPHYSWFKDEKEPVTTTTNSHIYYSVIESRSYLHIDYVEKFDEAYYTCYAENIFGYVKQTFKLQVQETDSSIKNCNSFADFCIYGICNVHQHTCQCFEGYIGRRCNYHDSS